MSSLRSVGANKTNEIELRYGDVMAKSTTKESGLDPAKMYEVVCKERFQSIDDEIAELDQKMTDRLDPMAKAVSETRERVFDGLSDLPARVNWMLGILALFLLGVGSLMYMTGRNQARMETLFETYIERSETAEAP